MTAAALLLAGIVLPAVIGARALRAPALARRGRARHRSTLVAAALTATAVVSLARSLVPWGFSVPAYWYLTVAAWATAVGGSVWALPQLPRTRPSLIRSGPVWLVAVLMAVAAVIAAAGPAGFTG